MLYQKEKEELKTLLRTGHPLIYIVTPDERPVVALLKDILQDLEEERTYELRTWDRHQFLFNETKGVRTVKKKASEPTQQDVEFEEALHVFEYIRNKKTHMINVFHDFHRLYDLKRDTDRAVVRALKNSTYDGAMPYTPDYTLQRYTSKQDHLYKHTIITAPVLEIPKELEKLAYVIEFSLPGKREVEDILTSMEEEAGLQITPNEREDVIHAVLGLTEHEIFYALKKAMFQQDGPIRSEQLRQEKKQLFKKNKTVEYIDQVVTLEDVGGMDELARWIKKRKRAFHEPFRTKYHVDVPKGVLLTGVQGCGKSYMVKAMAHELQLPLLRLNMGSMMSKWVGESDENLRSAIALIETMAPCVLWIDEMEKSMPNANGNAHETTQRIFGHLLTWLQEKTSTVFVVATTNRVDLMPPELLRKGRFDDIFFVDLPTHAERKAILSIHLRKKDRDETAFDLDALATACVGFSGAEIEASINEAVLEAAVCGEFVTQTYIEAEMQKTTPLSRTMKEAIESMRSWAASQVIRRVSSETSTFEHKIGF